MTNPEQTETGTKKSIFSRISNGLKQRKKRWIFPVIIIAVTVFILSRLFSGTVSTNIAQIPQTLVLETMDLQQIVSGTGTLQSRTTREISTNLSYEITRVHVEEGAYVESQQTLAQLDTSELDRNIAAVRRNIADAEAQDALTLKQAERKLSEAISMRDINRKKNDAAVTEARNALDNTPSEASSIAWADAASVSEKAALDEADAAWSVIKSLHLLTDADGPGLSITDIGYLEWTALKIAQYDYNNRWNTVYQASKQERAAAQADYDRAVDARDAAYRNDNISVEDARDSVNSQKLRDSALSYRTQLEGYLADRENCTILAPVSGTITTMTAAAGHRADSAAALFTIEDSSHLEIRSIIPEYDIGSIKAGLPVTITSDAIDTAEWTGSVKQVSAKATDENGNFTVVVSVTSPADELTIGMSTKFNIITESKNGVFAVPYDAVTTNASGETVIYEYASMTAPDAGSNESGAAPEENSTEEMPGAAPERREIRVATGLETDYYIEVTGSGLREGIVILTDPEGKNDGTGEMFFPMGGGGF